MARVSKKKYPKILFLSTISEPEPEPEKGRKNPVRCSLATFLLVILVHWCVTAKNVWWGWAENGFVHSRVIYRDYNYLSIGSSRFHVFFLVVDRGRSSSNQFYESVPDNQETKAKFFKYRANFLINTWRNLWGNVKFTVEPFLFTSYYTYICLVCICVCSLS